MVGTQTQTYVKVPQHGRLSLYTRLEGPSITKIDFPFPHFDLHMIFKGPWFFMVMALGMCVKWPSM